MRWPFGSRPKRGQVLINGEPWQGPPDIDVKSKGNVTIEGGDARSLRVVSDGSISINGLIVGPPEKREPK